MSDETWEPRDVHWTDEEMAHGSSGLSSTVMGWWEALRRGVSEVVWWAMDPDFRLVVAQQWLHDNPAALQDPAAGGHGRDELAAALAVERPDHALWPHLERFVLRALREATDLGDREVGAPIRSRIVAPGVEVVDLIPLDQLPVDESGTHI
ncbi:hypothetical protein [Kineococcus xinjiangensis]|uniref:hypothetical protein n=1 Tax=Kineococcus xinjiangensis TaxID=512762 RepID=UPI0011AFFAE1|nr:hypothetical protein [Kineococcus xinjiangensis]